MNSRIIPEQWRIDDSVLRYTTLNNQHQQPRVVYLEATWEQVNSDHHQTTRTFLVQSEGEAELFHGAALQDDWQPHHEERCLPKAEWQTRSFPVCNSIHEIDVATLAGGVHNTAEESISVLGEGWFRTTWRFDRYVAKEALVLKTLRMEREFLSEYYELHRRDAVAMERLTSSSFVVNVYGYCGQSATNELANFPLPGIHSLEDFKRRMPRNDDSATGNLVKLTMSAGIAQGVAAIHAANSMVHYDLKTDNVALFAGGRPKLNDFNTVEFLRYDPETNETCKFPSRFHEPWWRAPEEMNTTHTVLVDEKVDIYALGNILYQTLTTHPARGKQKKDREDEVRPLVAAGICPTIPASYANSTDPGVRAILKAIDLCWAKNPSDRATAKEIATLLNDALEEQSAETNNAAESSEVDI